MDLPKVHSRETIPDGIVDALDLQVLCENWLAED
jgi:hypothetical protein